MSIVEFPCRAVLAPGAWREDELRELMALLGPDVPNAEISGWEVGATEQGEPQFYVLGPAPDRNCVLCVSRLGQGYVFEDGAGRLLGEAQSLHVFAEAAARAAVRSGRSFLARATLLLCMIRLTIEEKLEPVLEETQELLARVAPQLVALV
jgi:hypothetical protein